MISHDLDLLDEAITRVIHLDREAEDATGKVVEYKGTYTQYLRAARAATRSAWRRSPSSRQARSAACRTLADAMRGQTAKRARVAKNLDARVARLEADRVEGPAARRTLDLRFPEPPSCGPHRAHRRPSSGRATARSTCSPTSASTSAAASAC